MNRALYASMGVAEYWRFNPAGALEGASEAGQRLEGSALEGLGYEPLARGADGSIRSEVLGLDVRVDSRPGLEHLLRFRDPGTGEDLLTFEESEQRLTEAELARAEAERARTKAEGARVEAERALGAAKQAAASEIARLKARVAELQAGRLPSGTEGNP